MIVTLTLNPSIDRTIELPGTLVRGAVQRLGGPATDVAAGKGVNVTRALAAAGIASRAVVMADPHDRFSTLLAADGIAAVCVPVAAPVRTNLAITEPDGTTTKLNEPGPELDAAAERRMLAALGDAAAGADWLVISGSLPAGARTSIVVDAIDAARRAAPRIRVAVDTSGPALASAVTHGVDLVKPNDEELEEFLGLARGAIAGIDAAATAARALVGRGVGAVLLTLGGAGAILADAERTFHATPPPTLVRSTVGAGDASLAGWLIAERRGDDAPGRLAQAVAHGSAAAALPGTGTPTTADADASRVDVTRLEAGAVPLSTAAQAAETQEH